MTTGTKIFLAVFALFIGVLVLYYGVFTPGGSAAPAIAATDDLSASEDLSSLARSRPIPAGPSEPILIDPAGEQRSTAVDPLADSPSANLDVDSIENSITGLGFLHDALGGEGKSDAMNSGDLSEAFESRDVNSPLSIKAESAHGSPRDPGDSRTDPVESGEEDTRPLDPDLNATKPVSSKPQANPQTPIQVKTQEIVRSLPSIQQPATSSSREYMVQPGDTMSSIASAWFGDQNKWSLIARANPLVDPSRMKVGQKLVMPPKDATLPQSSPRVTEQLPADNSVYVVRSGDTLIRIAREHYNDQTRWKAIYEANRKVIGNDPAALKLGMKLTLPPKSSDRNRQSS